MANRSFFRKRGKANVSLVKRGKANVSLVKRGNAEVSLVKRGKAEVSLVIYFPPSLREFTQ